MIENAKEVMESPADMVAMLTYEIQSTLPVDRIAQRVAQACEKNKFSILQTFDYFEILEKKGFPIKRKVFIYEVCQAKLASKMLTSHPEFAIFMPCKIALYENEGRTVISTIQMDLALKSLEDERELFEEATAMFASLKGLIRDLAEGK